MVTFTINIPPMLAYIYHTWILWVFDSTVFHIPCGYLVDTLWKLAFRSARCKSWRTSVAFKLVSNHALLIRNMTEPQQNDMEDHGRTIYAVCWCVLNALHICWYLLIMPLPSITVWLRVPPDVVAVPCRSHHWDSPCVACRFVQKRRYAPNYGYQIHQKWGTWW